MVSMKFPFSFSQPPKPPVSNNRPSNLTVVAAAACSAAGVVAAGFALSQNSTTNPLLHRTLDYLTNVNRNRFSPMWSSLSLADASGPVTESKTRMSFPSVLRDSQRLLGIGLRKKAVLGLKNIDVYAFGVYADDGELKGFFSEKYGETSTSEMKEKDLKDGLLESDVSMTVRLQIVYGRLSIKSVRNAFEESVGSRLKKFGEADNRDLLQRFTTQFKDEYKLPRGSIIDLSRQKGHVLQTTINGKEVGSIQSKLLCRSIFDLYIGDEPFDSKAQEDVQRNLATLRSIMYP